MVSHIVLQTMLMLLLLLFRPNMVQEANLLYHLMSMVIQVTTVHRELELSMEELFRIQLKQ